MPDLWPAELGTATPTPPVTILREQAQLLSAKTKGLVEGKVSTVPNRDKSQFDHFFYFTVPSLDNFSYRLLVVSHGIDLYPAQIHMDDESGRFWDCPDPESFMNVLKECFSDQRTLRVLAALNAQATEASSES